MNAWAWYWLAFPAWLIIIITATARLDDLDRSHWSLRWHIRRIGLMGVGVVAVLALVNRWTTDFWFYLAPNGLTALIAWSWAIVWLTTEGQQPWFDYILGVHRKTETWRELSWRERMGAEGRALRASFKPRRFRKPPPPSYDPPQGKLQTFPTIHDRPPGEER